MKRSTAAKAGMALAASVIIVGGMAGSASASGSNVTISRTWGTATFTTYGDELKVKDLTADGYSVHAKIQRYQKVNIDAWSWVDHRTGCYDTTTTSHTTDGYSVCDYDLIENDPVRVCIVRSKDGVRYGDWVCSGQTQA